MRFKGIDSMKKLILFIALISVVFAQRQIIKVEGQDLLKSLAYTESSPYVNLYEWHIGDGTVSVVEWDPNGNNWTPQGFERKGKIYLTNQGKITHNIVKNKVELGFWSLQMLGNKDKIIKARLLPSSITMENPSIYIDKAFIKEQIICEENSKLRNIVYFVKFPQKIPFWIEEKMTLSTQGNKSEYLISFDIKPECVLKVNTNKISNSIKISESTNEQIKFFLNSFYKVGEEIYPAKALHYYDSKIDQYFSMQNVTKEDILEDKIRYYKKWTIRKYNMKNFEIIDSYIVDSIKYYIVNTVVDWNVISAKGKSRQDTSYNIITLIETDNGFLVKSIKSLGGSTVKSRNIEDEDRINLADKRVLRKSYQKVYKKNKQVRKRYKVINVSYNDTLNVRKTPHATTYNKIAELLPNAKNIKIIKCKYNKKGTKWCKIHHTDYGYSILGWVIARCLLPQGRNYSDTITYRVIKIPTNDTLTVRTNAGTHNRKIGALSYYATGIKVIKCKKAPNGRKWCKVSHPFIMTGWVRSKYLRRE